MRKELSPTGVVPIFAKNISLEGSDESEWRSIEVRDLTRLDGMRWRKLQVIAAFSIMMKIGTAPNITQMQ